MVRRYAFAIAREQEATPSEEQVSLVLEGVEHGIRSCALQSSSSHIVVALDSSGATWRNELYPQCKAHRKASAPWSPYLRDYLEARGWTCCKLSRYEADDIVATTVRLASDGGHGSAVLSGDSDLLRLSGVNCEVYQFGGAGEEQFPLRAESWILAKYKLDSIAQLDVYKALVGEPGDNLPGVRGIGPVRARRLLSRYGGLEAILASAALAPDLCEQLRLMSVLVALDSHVPVDIDLSKSIIPLEGW